eukprot:TRINITY_DN4013_c0_g4_i1.p1 TRINITY_DN4013_c0_g4~~TRINITY_DN4013_c0_g4_i1.p1  ORF type:complete len:189 (+),score=-20.96 TRINITY_DN4013_c0_g4_i1:270-836(+)
MVAIIFVKYLRLVIFIIFYFIYLLPEKKYNMYFSIYILYCIIRSFAQLVVFGINLLVPRYANYEAFTRYLNFSIFSNIPSLSNMFLQNLCFLKVGCNIIFYLSVEFFIKLIKHFIIVHRIHSILFQYYFKSRVFFFNLHAFRQCYIYKNDFSQKFKHQKYVIYLDNHLDKMYQLNTIYQLSILNRNLS